jgi:hypothetical protein
MVLTVYPVIFPVIGLCCHRHRRILPADLTPASRRQNHTTSPSAPVPFVSSTFASTASRPAFVTIASAPCLGRDGAGYGFDLGEAGRNIFLQMGLDRHLAKQPVGQIGPMLSFPEAHPNSGLRQFGNFVLMALRTTREKPRHHNVRSIRATAAITEIIRVNGRKDLIVKRFNATSPVTLPSQMAGNSATGFRHGRASSRPSTKFVPSERRTWMPGTKPGHDGVKQSRQGFQIRISNSTDVLCKLREYRHRHALRQNR